MDLLDLCKELIAADTVSHRGTAAAVAVLKPLYESAGLEVRIQEVVRDGVRHQNLLGTYPGDNPAGLLLVTHLDTVDPGPRELWTETGGQPFRLTRKGDLLYGLGSADTKLDALCKLFAARDFKGRRLRRSLQLLGTFEEEVGCKGARHFAGSPDFHARFAACSEPSELVIIRAHKGYAVVHLTLELPAGRLLQGPFVRVQVDGKSAHSSTPHLGVNALEKAAQLVGGGPLVSLEGGTVANKVPSRCVVVRPASAEDLAEGTTTLPIGRASDASATLIMAQSLFSSWKADVLAQEPRDNPAFDPSAAVASWGIARIEAHRAELTFDARLLPGHDPDDLVERFSARAQELTRARGGRSEVKVDRASPAMELTEPSELLAAARAACRDVGLPDAPQAKPTNTEAGVFARAGIEAIVLGPGRSTGNAHTPNEHNLHSQLLKAVELHRALITRLCT